jgi:signal peptidase I
MRQGGWSEAAWGFFVPRIDRRFLLRLTVLAAAAWGFFGGICRPMRIQGASMEPAWHDGGVTFCWRPRFWFRAPRRGDVVMIRFAGERVMLLKRVVALGGETVAFQGGTLLVDGKPLDEPYVRRPCAWDMPPRAVGAGKLYVVGDNREMLLELHQFGEVHPGRIVGGPLW